LKISSYADLEAALAHKSLARFQVAGVLLKKQEKMSQKGSKYAFLQLSDPTGIFEVTLFSEILSASRAFLEPGALLLLTVEAEQREEQIRITCSRIELLEAALEGKIRSIDIRLFRPEPAKVIREMLDRDGRGAAVVNLFVRLDEARTAHIQIPGRWNLSAQARNAIRAQEGVLEISEG
jgi:DNA polymerase III subunit alpha